LGKTRKYEDLDLQEESKNFESVEEPEVITEPTTGPEPKQEKADSFFGSVVYVGPSFIDSRLIQYTVFKIDNGLPDWILALQKACPALKGLFVPVGKIAQSRMEIQQAGSGLAQLCAIVTKWLKEDYGNGL